MSPWIRQVQEQLQDDRPYSGKGLMKSDFLDPIGFIFPAFLLAIILAVIVTWFVVARFPIPSDAAIELGLLGFFFVVFFDLVFMVRLVVPRFQEGQRAAAAKSAMTFILLGLLVASLVGVLPWSVRWLFELSPWVPRLFNALLILLITAVYIRAALRFWRVRKAKQRDLERARQDDIVL